MGRAKRELAKTGIGVIVNAIETYSIETGSIPTMAFVGFQMMFAAITPALISGAFAERMVMDHGALSDSMAAITSAAGITPRPNRESEVLHTQTQATLEALRAHEGAAFDSVYAAAMVQSHEVALNLIDSQLLAGASDQRLRTAIETRVRPAVAGHLEQIRQIQANLSSQ